MSNKSHEEGFASDDERLSSLIDGELPAAAAAELERRLAAEPELAQRLRTLRRGDAALRKAYASIEAEPLSAGLSALLRRHGIDDDISQDAAGAAAKVVPLRRHRPPISWVPTSIAAGIALAIGLALGLTLGPRDRLTDTQRLLASGAAITPDRELFEVIESVPSGETQTLAGNVAATPRLTFRTADGDYCREIELASSTRRTSVVGCRQNGAWRPEGVTQFSASSGELGNDSFVPASGPADGLDAIVGELMAGIPLSADAERDAIAAGWQ